MSQKQKVQLQIVLLKQSLGEAHRAETALTTMDREEVNDDVKVTVDISHVKTILFSDHLEQTFQQNSGTQGCNLRTPDLLAVMSPTLTAALGSMGSLSDI